MLLLPVILLNMNYSVLLMQVYWGRLMPIVAIIKMVGIQTNFRLIFMN